jgi:hypothetical protein
MIQNLIASLRTKRKDNQMRTFKTLEELIEFASDQENSETLANGEIALKDWCEDFKALRKYLKEYGQTTSSKEAWESQKEELTQRVAELTEQLDSAHDELAGLKEITSGDDKEMLQRLNASIIALKTKNMLLEKRVAVIPDLQRKIDEWNSSRIVEEAKRAAAHYKVPQNIIDDPDFETIVTSDLTIDDAGNVFVKGDYLQSAYDYIATKQTDRPHWKPIPHGDSGDNGRVSDELAAIASLYAQGGSSGKRTQPISRDDRLSDELAAIAALFG